MTKLLVLITVLLALITVWRIIRVLELVRELRGDEEYMNDGDSRRNGLFFILFLVAGLIGMAYFTLDAKKYLLPIAASKHGVLTDDYLNLNFAIIIVVFIITQVLLFGFAYKYRHRKGQKAYFYPDNHKLELIWTAVPAVVLMGLIVYGLKLWTDITGPEPKEAMVIEIYGKQFDWTARYSGQDNQLGKSNFKLITDDNPLGVDAADPLAKDDKITRDLYLPVNTPVVLKIHSRDIIHSVYLPHLRAQMNAVPGMTTQFHFEPTITTDSMKLITGNDKFSYILLCNKICGVAHYMMRMNVVVTSPEEFKKWYAGQQYVFARPEEAAPVAPTTDSTKTAGASTIPNKTVASLK
ncbi:MAG: cytochrome c oxidase subunit II [Bacteroidota bacterium]